MTEPTDPLAERFEGIRRALAAVANDRPTPEQIAEWNAADKAMAQRIRAAVPGVPLHHAYAVLRALRVREQLDAAAAPAAPAVPAPATDQAALVKRVAAALQQHGMVHLNDPDLTNEYDCCAEAAIAAVLPAPADRVTVLREEAALIRAHCPDHLDSNSADGSWMNCHCDVADDMERRMAAESAPATAPLPVRHAPGKAILCPDCRDKGHSACMADEQPAAAQQPICKCPAEICQCGHHKAQQPKEA